MAEQEYGRLDRWRDSARTEESVARELAAALELRAGAEDQAAARAAYLDLLGVGPGSRVLEVGCGGGAVTRDVARRVAPNGLVVGLDPSPAFLRFARELVERDGLEGFVDLREGDGRALPFGQAEFDVVLAVTALAHVPDGERAIPEMARVARPGGRVGIFDLDGDSAIISHPDRALTRRIVAASSDDRLVNGWLGRELPGRLSDAGLRDVQIRAFTPLERDPDGFYARVAELRARGAVEVGAISAEEEERWLEALRAVREAGRFVGGQTHLFAWGAKPE
jgi:ubiquinone/menaquinone biosynthesis C-methylase UbiE